MSYINKDLADFGINYYNISVVFNIFLSVDNA